TWPHSVNLGCFARGAAPACADRRDDISSWRTDLTPTRIEQHSSRGITMRTTLKHTIVTTGAIIGLSTFAATAAPSAGDPTTTRPSATTNSQSATKNHPGLHH